MRIIKLFSTLLFVGTVASNAIAQDIHFSMFDLAPNQLNPALTGAYEGTFRLGGIYRDQFNAFVKGYRTPSAYLDAPLFRLGEYSWIGAGVGFTNDVRGTGSLNNLGGMLGLAAHFPLTASRKVYLSVGAQGGYVQEKIDKSKLLLEDQFNPADLNGPLLAAITNDPGLTTTTVSYADFNAGLLLNAIVSTKLNFNVGFSSQHLAEPKEAFLTGGEQKRPRKYIGHATVNVDLTPKITFSPMAFYQMQRSVSELNVQGLFGFHFNTAKDVTFLAGAGYRVGDAAIARVGFNLKGLKIAAAYDINTSSLTDASNRRGGFEIAASYTAKIFRTKVLPTRVICPRF